MSEKIFFDENGVKVTNARVIVHGDTYALANITSCKARYEIQDRIDTSNAKKRNLTVFLCWLGIILTLGFGIVNGMFLSAGIVAIILFIVMYVFKSIFRDKPYTKNLYKVSFGSASGEKDLIESYDEEFIRDVVSSVNEAIIARG